MAIEPPELRRPIADRVSRQDAFAADERPNQTALGKFKFDRTVGRIISRRLEAAFGLLMDGAQLGDQLANTL